MKIKVELEIEFKPDGDKHFQITNMYCKGEPVPWWFDVVDLRWAGRTFYEDMLQAHTEARGER